MYNKTRLALAGVLALGGIGVLGCQNDHKHDRTSSNSDIKKQKDSGYFGGDGKGRNETTAGVDPLRDAKNGGVRTGTSGTRTDVGTYDGSRTSSDIKQGKDSGAYGGDGRGTNAATGTGTGTGAYDRTRTGSDTGVRGDGEIRTGEIRTGEIRSGTDVRSGEIRSGTDVRAGEIRSGTDVRSGEIRSGTDARPGDVRTYDEAGTPKDIKQGKDAGYHGGDGPGNIRSSNPDR